TSEADNVCIAKANEAGQGHIFEAWDELSPQAQRDLIRQVQTIDYQNVKRLNHQRLHGRVESLAQQVLKPAPVERLPSPLDDTENYAECRRVGEEAIRAGKVGLVMVSGASSIGPLGEPTGYLPVGPVTGKSGFQLHAEKIRALNIRHKVSLRWWIVVHPDALERVREFFRSQAYFGLNCSKLIFSPQPMMPLVNRRGKFLRIEPGRLAMESTGHGGVLLEFLKKERLEELRRDGIEYLFFFLVDNPLVKIADPLFIGRHILSGAEVSSKTVAKLKPDEKVGVFCQVGSTTAVIEYSELSPEDRELKTEDGSLAFHQGNVAVHMFSTSFFQRMVDENVQLPFHIREHTVQFLDKRGHRIRPTEPNCVQFRYFAFDALRVAQKAILVEVSRDEEFSPIKCSQGDYSPQAAVRNLSRLYARWLRNAGATFKDSGGDEGLQAIEISPLYALDEAELTSKIELPLHVEKDLYLGGRSL
ncbi:MAG: UTP--glucose-1-phosphate uridylyltransferase, partial [Planctomycetes bacterium]|nr:UTP--glucose-1-phosphate uridylyltransferase [Planctomycetota bacterium]